MSDELKDIQLEIARLKLRREQLALEDELQKRAHKQQAIDVGKSVAGIARDVVKPKKGVLNWMVITPAILGLLLAFVGSSAEQSLAMSLIILSVLVYLFRWFRSR